MPPKRKTARGGGRAKRPRESSVVAQGSDEQAHKRQRVDDTSTAAAPDGTAAGSSKIQDHPLLAEGDEDAEGEAEDDRMDPMQGEDAEGQREDIANPDHVQGQDAVTDDGNDTHQGVEMDTADPTPSTSTRGRGRGRGRGRRGRGAPPPRSSPRKGPADPTSTPPNPRGRKATRGRGRSRGTAASDPSSTNVHAIEDGIAQANESHNEETAGDTTVTGHRPLPEPEPESPEPQFQQHQRPADDAQQQLAPQIPAADPALQTPSHFTPHPHVYYPTYSSHAPPFSYQYVPPPPHPAAPDGRSYLALRPDGGPPVYGASFATTVGTGNGINSASPCFNASYPTPVAPEHSLDANAPQGNPFPPAVPMVIPAYGSTVYSVGAPSDDDDDDVEPEPEPVVASSPVPPKPKPPVIKSGGRAGRGDHVACHFCRGRKLKCDGRRPTCGHCSLRSLACDYDEAVRRRGPGRKEKNNRRDRNGAGSRRTGGVVVPDLSVGPQPPTQSHAQMTGAPEAAKRKRRNPTQTAHQSQTSVLRFDEGEGASMPAAPVMKPASTAYGVANNERLGYYYAGAGPGPQYGAHGAPYPPPYGAYDPAGTPQQPAYGYTQEGGDEDADDGNPDMGAEGEGDGDNDVYGSRPGENSYGQPPSTENYSHAWPAEPPGGVPVSHPHTQHM